MRSDSAAAKRRGAVGIEDDLHEAFAVPQVDEDDAAMVAATVDPAHQRDRLAEVPAVDSSTVVSALQCILRRALRVAFGIGQVGAGSADRAAARGAPRRDEPRPVNFEGWRPAGGAAGGAALRGWRRRGRNDAHRNDVLERVVDRHVELAHSGPRNHHEVAAGRVGRRRHVHADVLARKVVDDRIGRRAGQERDRPAARARKLDQQRLAKRRALVGEHAYRSPA